jgi:hypothetical protein
MFRALSVLLLLAGILGADEIADRKAIDAIVESLSTPEVRSDPQHMVALTATDFDGNLDLIPVHSIWCELSCTNSRVRALKFVTPDVAVADGETTTGTGAMSGLVWSSRWLMILTRDATGWRISAIRSSGSPSFVRGNRLAG